MPDKVNAPAVSQLAGVIAGNESWPKSWNECPYCGEAVEAPAIYCSEEHKEGRSMY